MGEASDVGFPIFHFLFGFSCRLHPNATRYISGNEVGDGPLGRFPRQLGHTESVVVGS